LELNIFQNLKHNGQAFNNENLPIVYAPFSFERKINFNAPNVISRPASVISR
jgi:hypothetical protein